MRSDLTTETKLPQPPASSLRMMTWVVCMTMQKCVMGFATELRARRFLEARHKPLKLLAKEKISATAHLAFVRVFCNMSQHVSIPATFGVSLVLPLDSEADASREPESQQASERDRERERETTHWGPLNPCRKEEVRRAP